MPIPNLYSILEVPCWASYTVWIPTLAGPPRQGAEPKASKAFRGFAGSAVLAVYRVSKSAQVLFNRIEAVMVLVYI